MAAKKKTQKKSAKKPAKKTAAKKPAAKKMTAKKAKAKKVAVKKVTAKKAAPKKAAPKKAAHKKAAAKTTAKKATTKKIAAPKKRFEGKIGILGGSFNPIHVGHMTSMMEVKQKLGLDKVFVIPANISPNKETLGPDVQERARMVEIAIAPYADELQLDMREVKRGGVSYTVETLEELNEMYSPDQLYFIMGADVFAGFDSWKNPEEILERANIVVTTRFGTNFSFEPHSLPDVVRRHMRLFAPEKIELTTGLQILHVEIEPVDASGTAIRKKLRDGKEVSDLIQPQVLKYIDEKGLYKRKSPLVDDYRAFTKFCAERAFDKKGQNVKAFDLSKQSSFVDYTVIASGTSTKHASSIAEGIVLAVKEYFGLQPLGVEGVREGRWILIDYGNVVIHVFYDIVREEYKIENLWKTGQEIPLNLAPERKKADQHP